MKKIIIVILLLVCSACSKNIEKENGDIIYKKAFGTYTINNSWKENHKGNKFVYEKVDNNITDNITVELVKNDYKASEHLQLRQLIYSELLKQNKTKNANIYGLGFTSDNNYNVYEFVIEDEESINKQYYIIGNYKYILVEENIYDKLNTDDISNTGEKIINSFKWR